MLGLFCNNIQALFSMDVLRKKKEPSYLGPQSAIMSSRLPDKLGVTSDAEGRG